MTIHRMPMTEARIHLGDVAKRAHNQKEYFILEKDGIPVIGIMAAEEMEDYLEVHNRTMKEQIQKSNEDIKRGRTRAAENFLEDIDSRHRTSKILKKVSAR